MLDDREAKTGAAGLAAARVVGPVEALCKSRQMLACDSRPMVGNAELHPGSVPLRLDIDRRIGLVAAVANRVADEVVEQLDQLRAVATKRRQACIDGDLEIATRALAQMAGIGDRGADNVLDVDAPGGRDVAVRLDPGE